MTAKILFAVRWTRCGEWYDDVLQIYTGTAYVNNECQPTIAVSHVRDYYGQIMIK
jgi:hypothetical protein